jgi:hypothetical protein
MFWNLAFYPEVVLEFWFLGFGPDVHRDWDLDFGNF